MNASVAFASEERLAGKRADKSAGAPDAAAAKPVVMVPAGGPRDGSGFVVLGGKGPRGAGEQIGRGPGRRRRQAGGDGTGGGPARRLGLRAAGWQGPAARGEDRRHQP